MRSVFGERRQVNGRTMLIQAIATSHAQLLEAVSRQLTARLVDAVSYLLGRGVYERCCQGALWAEQSGRCHRCGSQAVGRMMRNGYRQRSLLTPLGWVEFWLPRVRCQCGGSVEMMFEGLVRPYQRLSDLVDEEIRRWYRQGLSLRQLQAELAQSYLGPLALSTLLQRLHQFVPTSLPVSGSPLGAPIVQVDAIWVTQVLPNGRTFTDRKGRRRPCKSRHKRPLFIALGIWPETDQAQVLDWMLGASEESEAWLSFLTRLEAAGLRGEQGLQLIIHDGGTGLCGALQSVDFNTPTQRCLFHKLRNIADAIQLPTGLTRRQRSTRRKAILKEFRTIWQAQQRTTALRRYLHVVREFRHTQPQAVAALRRDFRTTLTFYQLSSLYAVRHLRTTSRLERFNRTLRTRLRRAAALHSDQGLISMITQQIHAFNASQISTN